MINLRWQRFNEFTNTELYEIMQARQAVFVVEQRCAYLDMDDFDMNAVHLSARAESVNAQHSSLLGYLRVLPPGDKFQGPSIGRVLTLSRARGTGLGKQLLANATSHCLSLYPGLTIYLSAQAHLQGFYGTFGFTAYSQPYDEDGIPHVDMQLLPTANS